jgi:hypothetical protein
MSTEQKPTKESLVPADHNGYKKARQLERFLSYERRKPYSGLKRALHDAQTDMQPGGILEKLRDDVKKSQHFIAVYEETQDTESAEKERNEMHHTEQKIKTREREMKAPLIKAITAEIDSALALAKNKVGSKHYTSFFRYAEMLFAEVEKNDTAIPERNTQELCALATTFIEIHEREQEEFEAFGQEMQIAFTNDLRAAIARGDLPASAAANLAGLSNVLWRLISVTDYGEEATQVQHTTLGQHHRSGVIQTATPIFVYDKEQAKKNAYHEMLHEIAGAARHYIPHIIDNDFTHSKSGLSAHRAFTWLNEAVTEYLALELLGIEKEKSESYVTEREKLQELFEKGLNKMLVWEAYFEDITCDQEKKERGEKYNALVQAINNIEGVGGFNRIEYEFILSNAVYDAQNLLQATGFTKARKTEAITFSDTETIHTQALPATHRIILTVGTDRGDTPIAQQRVIEIGQSTKYNEKQTAEVLDMIKKRLLQKHRALRVDIETL